MNFENDKNLRPHTRSGSVQIFCKPISHVFFRKALLIPSHQALMRRIHHRETSQPSL